MSHDDFARSISTGSDTVLSNFVYQTNAVSVEAWVMLTASGASGAICGFANGPGSGNYDKDLYVSPAGQLVWYVWDGQVETVIGPVLNPHQVYHVVGTFDGATMHLYVNGTDVGQAPASSSYQGYVNDDVMVGGGTGGIPNTLSALVSEFAVYGYPLSPTRVLAHYDAGRAPYAAFVTADNPAAYWRLDEDGGTTTAVDSSGNGIVGSYSGSYLQNATGALQGSADTAAAFTGGQVSGGGFGANNPGDPITIEAWVEPEDLGNTLIFGKGSGSWAYSLSISAGQIATDGGAGDSGAYVPVDQWSYVAIVFRPGNNPWVYVNGVQAGTGTGSVALDTSGDWTIGTTTSAALIDEVAVYKQALTAAQISQHYMLGAPTYKQTVVYDSPIIYWRLGEQSGSTVYDDSGWQNTGALSGAYTLASGGGLPTDGDTSITFNGGSLALSSNSGVQCLYATVEAWAQLTALPSGNALVAGFADGNQADKDLYVDSGGHVDWLVNDGTPKVITGPVLTVGQWYHLVGTAGSGSSILYVDGQNVGSASAGSTLTGYAPNDFHVAGGVTQFENINGAVDEAAVYDYNLSSPQVAKHYTVATSYYAGVVLADSPVAYWRLADTGSTALDSTGNGANGTYSSGVTHTSEGAQFDGSGYISGYGMGANSATDTYTVEAWVDPSFYGGTFFAKGNPDNQIAFGIGVNGIDSNGNADIMLESQNDWLYGGALPLNKMSDLVAVFSPLGTDVYLNGQHYFHSDKAIYPDSTGVWTIGAQGTDPLIFSGVMRDVAVYNYRLTADQIMRHYMIGLGYSVPS